MADEQSIQHLLARICALESAAARLSELEARVEVMDDDISDPQKRFISESSEEESNSSYLSYFRVVDASTAENCVIGVTNGMDWPEGGLFDEGTICGTVKINNVRVDLDPDNSGTIESACEVYVWLLSEITVMGEAASIVFGTQTPPVGTGLVYANRLLGRATVSDVGAQMRITSITQDYLTGGEHAEYLNGDCGDYYAEPPS